jgi:hypothetical protein
MKYVSFFVLGICLSVYTMAQHAVTAVNFITTDITQSKPFAAENITVYGIHLGMSRKEVLAALQAEQSVVSSVDRFNTQSDDANSTTQMRIYVYAKGADGKGANSLLYLIWNEGSAGLDRIVFFVDMKTMAVGDTKKLFGNDAVDTESEFYKRFLVKVDDHIDGSYTIKDRFFAKDLEVITYKKSNGKPNDVYFALDRKLK